MDFGGALAFADKKHQLRRVYLVVCSGARPMAPKFEDKANFNNIMWSSVKVCVALVALVAMAHTAALQTQLYTTMRKSNPKIAVFGTNGPAAPFVDARKLPAVYVMRDKPTPKCTQQVSSEVTGYFAKHTTLEVTDPLDPAYKKGLTLLQWARKIFADPFWTEVRVRSTRYASPKQHTRHTAARTRASCGL